MNWLESKATREEMAVCLDAAKRRWFALQQDFEIYDVTMDRHLRPRKTPPEEPKEELPEEVEKAIRSTMFDSEVFDDSPNDGMKVICKALLSHIKSSLDKRDEKIVGMKLSLNRMADQVRESRTENKSHLDKRDEVIHDVRHYVAKEIGELRKELDKRDENLKEWTEDLLTRRFEFHIRNHNHRPTGQKEG